MGDRISKQADGKDLKPYTKPTLKKGPVLSNVAAAAASGAAPAP